MADVFISYSRVDKDFVKKLHSKLKEQGLDAWVDWEDIPLSANWWKEVQIGIETANSFVFILSINSIASKICRKEVDHAVKYNKRLIPIVRRQDFDIQEVHPAISRYNWIFFQENNEFETNFEALIKAIDTDLNHVKIHTHLLTSAIEWSQENQDSSFLLRGSRLSEAEKWLSQNANKEPIPTDLHRDYINASLSAETASLLYRNIVELLNKVAGVFSGIRQSKRHLLTIPIEWSMYLLACSNMGLVVLDVTYLSLRDFYTWKAPAICRFYDPLKGIEPQRDTTQYLTAVDNLAKLGIENPAVDQQLSDLRDRSVSIIQEDPFRFANKSGSLEKLKRLMRQHMGVKSSKEAFRRFWNLSHLTAKTWPAELAYFNQNLRPIIAANYFRSIDESGEFLDSFWQIDILYIALFFSELLLRSLYLSKRLNIPIINALRSRWYDFFWLTFTVYWNWLRLLHLIPFLVRSYHLGLFSYLLHKSQRTYLIKSVSNADDSI
jgi:TIR domain